jgi:DNA-binding NarL/FixJ family response regulator
MSKLRIFLAEDHSMVREGLKLLVNSQPDMEVVGEAGDGRIALQKVSEILPDVVVMDISMPELGGAAATEQLKRHFPKIQVLALSVHEDKSYLRELLEAGASGYVLKRAAAEELITAIRIVSKNGVYLDPTLTSKVVSSFVQTPPRETNGHENSLSLRESEVVRLIAQGYSNKEIASNLNISVKTVETYKARAMEKLDLHSRSDLVRYALTKGWMQEY